MIHKQRNTRTSKLAGLLLIIFLSFFSAQHFFNHSHLVNGKIIQHSHPYSNSKHTHSTADLLVFSSLSHWISALPKLTTVGNCLLVVTLVYKTIDFKQHQKTHLHRIYLRGPPTLATHTASA